MFLALLILWIIFNGRLTLEVLIIGILMSALLTLFAKKFFYNEKIKTKHSLKYYLLMLEYICILIVEIIKANFIVLGIVVEKKLVFEPTLLTFKTDIKNKSLRVLLADSITLTPGTITVELHEDGKYVVHCLDKSLGDDIENSIFVKKIRELEEC